MNTLKPSGITSLQLFRILAVQRSPLAPRHARVQYVPNNTAGKGQLIPARPLFLFNESGGNQTVEDVFYIFFIAGQYFQIANFKRSSQDGSGRKDFSPILR